jgi:hypothetical protein
MPFTTLVSLSVGWAVKMSVEDTGEDLSISAVSLDLAGIVVKRIVNVEDDVVRPLFPLLEVDLHVIAQASLPPKLNGRLGLDCAGILDDPTHADRLGNERVNDL